MNLIDDLQTLGNSLNKNSPSEAWDAYLRLKGILTPSAAKVLEVLPELIKLHKSLGVEAHQNEGDLAEVWHFGEGEFQIADFATEEWAHLACEALNAIRRAAQP